VNAPPPTETLNCIRTLVDGSQTVACDDWVQKPLLSLIVLTARKCNHGAVLHTGGLGYIVSRIGCHPWLSQLNGQCLHFI
jgi:hypothetical protein